MRDRDTIIIGAAVLLAVVMAAGGLMALSDGNDSDAYGDTVTGGLCMVQFVPNFSGSQIGTSGAETVYVVTGNTIDLPSTMFTHTDTQKYLKSWRLGSIEGEEWKPGADFEVTEDTIFYAEWERVDGEFVHDRFDLSIGERIDWSFEIPALSTTGDATFGNVEAPEWLTVTPHLGEGVGKSNIQFSGNPPEPGVWCVHFKITELFVFDQDYYFFIRVDSNIDQKITFVYDADGGNPISTNEEFILRAGTAEILLDAGSTYKSGMDLLGWKINDGANNYPIYALGSAYTAGADLLELEMPIKLTAAWEEKANILILDANGGTGTEGWVVREGQTVTFPDQSQIDFKKSGYVLKGWFFETDPDAIYAPEYIYEVGSQALGAIYVKAYWVPVGTELITVEFSANGGNDYDYSQSVELGKSVVTPRYGPTMENKALIGWYTSPTCDDNSKMIIPGTKYRPEGNTVLYAQYVQDTTDPDTTHSVVFDPSPGTGANGKQEVLHGQLAKEPAEIPERDRYIFAGWRVSGTTMDYDFGSPVYSDIVLSAHWIEHFETPECTGSTVVIHLNSDIATIGDTKVDWGDGEVEDVYLVGTHTYTSDYIGDIRVTTTDSNGKEHTSTASIKVVGGQASVPGGDDDPQPVKASAEWRDNGDGTYTFTSTSTGDIRYLYWTVNDQRKSSDVTETFRFEPGTINHVELTVIGMDNLIYTWDTYITVPHESGTDWVLWIAVIAIILLVAVFVGRWFL